MDSLYSGSLARGGYALGSFGKDLTRATHNGFLLDILLRRCRSRGIYLLADASAMGMLFFGGPVHMLSGIPSQLSVTIIMTQFALTHSTSQSSRRWTPCSSAWKTAPAAFKRSASSAVSAYWGKQLLSAPLPDATKAC